jgi:hypothetical protein
VSDVVDNSAIEDDQSQTSENTTPGRDELMRRAASSKRIAATSQKVALTTFKRTADTPKMGVTAATANASSVP